MFKFTSVAFLCFLELTTALPPEPIFRKLDSELRYQYEVDSAGQNHLVDTWMTLSNIAEAARYDPATSNVYHLFTRANSTTSQPLLLNNANLLQQSNFDSTKRTIVLIHGWRDNVISDFNTVLVPAFLAAEDVNVIVVDWSAGSSSIVYSVVLANTITSGLVVAQFINWVNEQTGATPSQYHIIGHGLGGQKIGTVSRNVQGAVAYITGLDPSLLGWINHSDRLQPGDSAYTEVIHTNSGINGYLSPLGHVDFYPNGGESMPGCDTHACDHARSFFYFGESITSGGFMGRECVSYWAAIMQTCFISNSNLHMGGLTPKNGRTGVFLVETNAAPPFSRG